MLLISRYCLQIECASTIFIELLPLSVVRNCIFTCPSLSISFWYILTLMILSKFLVSSYVPAQLSFDEATVVSLVARCATGGNLEGWKDVVRDSSTKDLSCCKHRKHVTLFDMVRWIPCVKVKKLPNSHRLVHFNSVVVVESNVLLK